MGHAALRVAAASPAPRSLATSASATAEKNGRWSSHGQIIDVERIDANVFRTASLDALWHPPMGKGIYGGQMIGQALVAAHETIDDEWAKRNTPPDMWAKALAKGSPIVNSAHAYFLRPGDVSKHIVFRVERVLDGGSFNVRTVLGMQDGTPIFSLMASFHRREAFPTSYQRDMSDVPPPDGLKSNLELLQEAMSHPKCTPEMRAAIEMASKRPFPLEIRPIDVTDIGLFSKPKAQSPRQRLWIRSTVPVEGSTEAHRCIAAWASDWTISATPLLRLGLRPYSPQLALICSLDHSLWFHDETIDVSKWILYEMETESLKGGRGVARGRMYDASGTLKLSVAQEALYRLKAGFVPPPAPAE